MLCSFAYYLLQSIGIGLDLTMKELAPNSTCVQVGFKRQETAQNSYSLGLVLKYAHVNVSNA